MWAEFGDEPELSLPGLEEHEILAEKAKPHGPTLFHFGDGRNGLPITAKKVAGLRTGTHSR